MDSFLGESFGDAAGADENWDSEVAEAERLSSGIVEGYRDLEAGRLVRFCGELRGCCGRGSRTSLACDDRSGLRVCFGIIVARLRANSSLGSRGLCRLGGLGGGLV